MPYTPFFLDANHYVNRTDELIKSGYPVKVTILDYVSDEAPMIQTHAHDEIEFLYILKGQASVTCEENTVIASQGDILFINSRSHHIITPVSRREGVFASIVINPIFICGLGELALEQKYINPILNCNRMNLLHISAADRIYHEFQPQITQLIDLNLNKSSCYELLTKICILKLWILLYDHYFVLSPLPNSVCAPRATTQDEQRIKQALLFIHEHYTEPVSLNDIADSILVSRSECCHCFKRVLNMTPFEYLMKYRILQAAGRMQKYPHESVSEIAGIVGFNNVSYFNKIFKKIMNDTPTRYKKSFQNSAPISDEL